MIPPIFACWYIIHIYLAYLKEYDRPANVKMNIKAQKRPMCVSPAIMKEFDSFDDCVEYLPWINRPYWLNMVHAALKNHPNHIVDMIAWITPEWGEMATFRFNLLAESLCLSVAAFTWPIVLFGVAMMYFIYLVPYASCKKGAVVGRGADKNLPVGDLGDQGDKAFQRRALREKFRHQMRSSSRYGSQNDYDIQQSTSNHSSDQDGWGGMRLSEKERESVIREISQLVRIRRKQAGFGDRGGGGGVDVWGSVDM